MKMKIALLLASTAALASCGGGNAVSTSIEEISRRSVEWTNPFAGIADENVSLTVWGGENLDSINFINQVARDFKKANPKSNYTIQVKPVSESSVSGDWEQDPSNAADVAIAADDQIPSMVSSGRLVDLEALSAKKIPGLAENVIARNLDESIEVLTHDGKTYGFPVSASNGFVLYYNAKYLTADDVTSFDKMLAAIHKASETEGKNFVFGYPYNSGWYLDGWFHGAGFNVHGEAGALTVDCDWNTTVNGVEGKDVAGAMVKLAHGQYKRHWSAGKAEELLTRIGEGNTDQVIATINGTWSFNNIKKNWGENAKAAVLPSYHLDLANKDVRMHSVKGFKVAIINKNRPNAPAAAKFAEYLSNYESQIYRYDALNEAPTNINARSLVLTGDMNPAVKAINDQWDTSFVEKVNPTYWNPSNGLSVELSVSNSDTAKFVASGEGTAEIVLNYDEIQASLNNTVNQLKGVEE